MQGTIKRYNIDRGFGFIVPDAPGLQDVFFHFRDTNLSNNELEILQPGARVSFEIGTGRDGRNRALSVKVAEAKMTDIHGNPTPVGRYSGFVDD
jgi:cold shock CspA family protein